MPADGGVFGESQRNCQPGAVSWGRVVYLSAFFFSSIFGGPWRKNKKRIIMKGMVLERRLAVNDCQWFWWLSLSWSSPSLNSLRGLFWYCLSGWLYLCVGFWRLSPVISSYTYTIIQPVLVSSMPLCLISLCFFFFSSIRPCLALVSLSPFFPSSALLAILRSTSALSRPFHEMFFFLIN